MMGEDKHPVTDQEIIKNSILYEYLGQTYENIFRVVPADPRPYLDALLGLTLKVIDMNMAGLTHNDINGKNVTYKDGKAYLIDIGLFEHEPRSTNFQDIQDLLKILYRIDTIMDQGYKARLQAYTVTPIRKNNIEEVREFLISLLQHIRTLPLAAPLAAAPPSQIEVVVVPDPMMEHPMVGGPSQGASAPKRPPSPANSNGNYAGGTRKKRTKAKGKAKTKVKRRSAH
jgi:hypothetical protein